MKTIWYTVRKNIETNLFMIVVYNDSDKQNIFFTLECLSDADGNMFMSAEEEIQLYLDSNGYEDEEFDMVQRPTSENIVKINDISERCLSLYQDGIYIGAVTNHLQFLDIRLQVKNKQIQNVLFVLNDLKGRYDYPVDLDGGIDYGNKPMIFGKACDQLNELLGI